ncbi:hypothetical protein [Pontibacter ruber]|uniref:STAS/SEC14 domain-containing protein n=1 Tax=Pontibacter ruber TaxID=1343895 RepID=A0ABW5CYI6_9BACT|nr:hypothetical protein [Pontibacter ruber]
MLKEVRNAFGRIFYRIEYKSDLNIVEAIWEGTATKNDLKHAVVAGLQLHEDTHCPYRLNDNTNFFGHWAEAVAWLEEEWLPRAHKSGIRYLAHVAHPRSFGELAGEEMLKGKIGANIQVCLFTDREQALSWLKAKQELYTSK